MATTQKIRNDIAKTKEKIAEQQKRLRALEAQLAEEEKMCIRDRYETVDGRRRCRPHRHHPCTSALRPVRLIVRR